MGALATTGLAVTQDTSTAVTVNIESGWHHER